MRQVPENGNYLLIGGGKLARHLAHYMQSLDVSFLQWKRYDQSVPELLQFIENQSKVLLCIKDDQLQEFYSSFGREDRQFVHFSGTFSHPKIQGFHPLMTFGQELYDLETYESIHFVGTTEEIHFRETFPFLRNSFSTISEEHKSLYHSLCVLSGNGTTLLWDLIDQEFQKLGLPKEALDPYLKQVSKNIQQGHPGRWSGPWYRQDQSTIEKNQQALQGRPLLNLYQEFKKLSQNSGT